MLRHCVASKPGPHGSLAVKRCIYLLLSEKINIELNHKDQEILHLEDQVVLRIFVSGVGGGWGAQNQGSF